MSRTEWTRVQEQSSAADARRTIREARCAGQSVGLVPTMGYLHEGHASLTRAARQENDLVVMSIFVNPTQFGPSEDFDRYPRDIARDRERAEAWGIDLLFTPTVEEMYPDGPDRQQVWVEPGSHTDHLCGPSRPGHFRGVATVVAKLFTMLEPDRAYFGQKDAQQLAVVHRMAQDLGFPVDIRPVPTVRESDGLALSSRNVYLGEDQRAQAPILRRALLDAAQRVESGERNPAAVEGGVRWCIDTGAPSARIDYVSVVDAETLQPLDGPIQREVLIALAVYFGRTRLIDNITTSP